MYLSFTKSISKSIHNGSLTATYSSDNHESMTYKRGFVKLDNFNKPVFNFKKIGFFKKSPDCSFNLFVNFLWNIALSWENIF
jgi:hypothetical protein